MLLVVADDLTGAAEMGGVAWREGFEAVVVRDLQVHNTLPKVDVTILDTDTRLLPPPQAADQLSELVGQAVARLKPRRIFKKIDSAFRGSIGAELQACLDTLGYANALVVVASPATRRYTLNGIHYVAGRPLAESEFGRDPVQPATNSHLPTVLSNQMGTPVTSASDEAQIGLSTAGVVIADARTDEDIDSWARALPTESLPVGSAAFGRALLSIWGKSSLTRRAAQDVGMMVRRPILIVSGSLAEASCRQTRAFRRSGRTVVELDHSASETVKEATSALRERGAVVLAGPSRQLPSNNANARGLWADILAQVATDVIDRVDVGTLVVTGGDTSGRLLRRLTWSVLPVVGESGQGIVALRPAGAKVDKIILKPGSYGDDAFYVRLDSHHQMARHGQNSSR